MNRHEALRIIKESGLIAEKMTDEEKAAKRKARREARKAEANAYKESHVTFETNKNAGVTNTDLYHLCTKFKSYIAPCKMRFGDDGGDEYFDIFAEKKDSSGNKHSAVIAFDLDKMHRKLCIVAHLEVDGRDTGETFAFHDSEASSGIFSSSDLNWEWHEYAKGRFSSFDIDVTINSNDFSEWLKKISQKAIEALDRAVAMADEESKDPGERGIPNFEHLEFEFTDDSIDDMTGERLRYRVPKAFVMEFFHKNCGEDNNSYKDFKDLFDSMDISYMRSMSEPASLFRGSFSFSQYKWFKRGGGELKGRLWGFPSFRGYENDDVQVKGWKLS
jgi:hypothetical protein